MEKEFEFLPQLIATIKQRKEQSQNPSQAPDSYVVKLFNKGINKVAQKVGEEAVELVIEAKDNNRELFLNEAADLFFHYLVLLEAKNESFTEVMKVLESRHKK
jgi:phosphoribosyl-ATP pyrophosphohydrolase/phosphoribosyl-AMP cyclohydrolase